MNQSPNGGASPIPIPGAIQEDIFISPDSGIAGLSFSPLLEEHNPSLDSGYCPSDIFSESETDDEIDDEINDGIELIPEGEINLDEIFMIKPQGRVDDFHERVKLRPKNTVTSFNQNIEGEYDVYDSHEFDDVTQKFSKVSPDRLYILHDGENKWMADHQKIGLRFCDYKAEMIFFDTHYRYADLEELVIQKVKDVKNITL